MSPSRIGSYLSVASLGIAVASCSDAPVAASHEGLHSRVEANTVVTPANGLLKQVHAATSRFHATTQAEQAGYAADPHCVEVPALGGMGHHWVNGANVDPVFDPQAPEVVLYAPDKHGNMKLVAVEYIVINVGQPRPSFDGHLFDIGGTPVPAAHWSLHVWVHQDNPNGTFTPFNPTVSCS